MKHHPAAHVYPPKSNVNAPKCKCKNKNEIDEKMGGKIDRLWEGKSGSTPQVRCSVCLSVSMFLCLSNLSEKMRERWMREEVVLSTCPELALSQAGMVWRHGIEVCS